MTEQLTIVMVAMHTSPLAQPGQGDAGGLNVYVRNLSQALIRQGHQVLAFTRKTSGTEASVVVDAATDSQVVPIATGRYALPKEALGSLTTQFAQRMVDEVTNRARHRVVVHSHYWLSGLAAVEAAHALQAPMVHTMHTLGAAKNSSQPGSEPAHRVERERYIAAKASVLIANTAAEKHELIQHTGVAPERVVVVPPGVDHHIFTPDGPAVWQVDTTRRGRKSSSPAECSRSKAHMCWSKRWQNCDAAAIQHSPRFTSPAQCLVNKIMTSMHGHTYLGWPSIAHFRDRSPHRVSQVYASR